jgi:O-antigen ligase
MDAPAAAFRSEFRFLEFLEWVLVWLLGSSLAWTTLCLGGYRPETMVVTGALNVAVAVVACVLAAGGAGRPWQPSTLWPVPFLAYALVNALWMSPVAWLAWREWLVWLQMWIVFATGLHFGRSRAHTRLLIGMALTLAVVCTAMAAYQRFFDWEWLMLGRKQLEQYRGRATGPFGIPNSLAAFLELVFLPGLTVALAREVSRAIRMAAGIAAVVAGCGIVLSVSRGGFIGIGLAILVWPVIAGGGWQQRLRRFAATVGAVVVVSVALYLAVPSVRTRLEPFLHGKWEASRPVLWRAVWEIFRTNPVFGSGAASYNIVFDRHRPRHFVDEPQWTHNDYLNVLSDYGLIGLGLFGVAGVGVLGVAWRRLRTEAAEGDTGVGWELAARQGMFLGVIAFALHLFVDFHLRIPALAFWCALTLALQARPHSAGPATEPIGRSRRWCWLGAALAVAVFGITRVVPVYRAEALRYGPRQLIDEYAATGKGDLGRLVTDAAERLGLAVAIDPANAQAWADLAYVVPLQVYAESLKSKPEPEVLTRRGHAAEASARRAVALSQVVPEFWVRLGAALDMQGKQGESGAHFEKAVGLAPQSGRIWYYHAYHLSGIPGREAEARRALGICLELDPNNPAAVALREQLNGRR